MVNYGYWHLGLGNKGVHLIQLLKYILLVSYTLSFKFELTEVHFCKGELYMYECQYRISILLSLYMMTLVA